MSTSTLGPFRAVVDVRPAPGQPKVEVLSCGHLGRPVGRYGPATKRRCSACLDSGVIDRIIEAGREGAAQHAETEAAHLRQLRAWKNTDEGRALDAAAREVRQQFYVIEGGRAGAAAPRSRASGG